MDEALRQQIRKRSQILETIKRDLIARLDLPYRPDDLHEDVSLLGSGLGIDSLDALEVILGVERAFGIKVPEDDVSILRSINAIADYVVACRAQTGGEG